MKDMCALVLSAGFSLAALAMPARSETLFKGGFQFNEASELLDLCIDVNGPGIDGFKIEIPPGWTLAYDGSQGDIGIFQNAWKLWKKGGENVYAIVLRGTISTKSSIVQDLLASTISASNGVISRDPDASGKKYLKLVLASTNGAEVELGFAYGMATLMFHKEKGILNHIKDLPTGSRIYIAGHSQGAAMATLAQAFLLYAPRAEGDIYHLKDKKFVYKSYVFAQPRPGNLEFSLDFGEIAANRGMSYVLNNSLDFVPRIPLTFASLDAAANSVFPQDTKGVTINVKIPIINIEKEVSLDSEIKAIQTSTEAIQKIKELTSSFIDSSVQKKFNETADQLDAQYFIALPPGTPDAKGSSLNYVLAGTQIVLRGDPDRPSGRESDWLWQHHGATYRKLLNQYRDVLQ